MRCGDLEAATCNTIKEADNALSVLRFGKKVKVNQQWESTKVEVMQDILENKCVQVPMFQEKLRTSKQFTIFVEATFNDEWGSGLDRQGTLNTISEHWPACYKLGQLLKKIAKIVRKRKLSDSVKVDPVFCDVILYCKTFHS
uniref:NADAR domain-containing protein n=1 Tax=Magallana gigas TaxID=29159 RepID=K1QWS6_MAGGI